MNQHPYYNPDHHGAYQSINIGDLDLVCGQTLHDCTLAVATHGRLNETRDNAVLIPTWYSGTSKIIEDVFIGPGRAIDPDKYFVMVINQIGNGLSSSPHQRPNASPFPPIAIADDVRAQHRYITQHLGLTRLALVMGGSMGAQQTFEWAVRFPDMVQRMAAIAGTARTSEINTVLADAIIDGLRTQPPSAGLSQHARLMTLYGLSAMFFEEQHFKPLGFDSVQALVEGFMQPYFQPMEPANLTTMLQKWRAADVSRLAGGDLREALGRITARALIMPIDQDMIFPPSTSQADSEMIKDAVFHVSSSPAGHLALFGIDSEWIQEVEGQLFELMDRE